MKVELFTVFDAAAARYMDCFCAPTIDFALRGFKEACGTEGHQFQKYPEDYTLYKCGSFDPDMGVVRTQAPVKIAQALSFVRLAIVPDHVAGVEQLDLEDQLNGELKT